MNLVSLPSWLPWWVPIAVIVPVSLYLLVFLLMPFSVFGVRSRLDLIEARLDEIQGEIRTLVLRFPATGGTDDEAGWPARRATRDRPPIPPGPMRAEADPDEFDRQDLPPPRDLRPLTRPPIPDDPRRRRPPAREEPRLDWRP